MAERLSTRPSNISPKALAAADRAEQSSVYRFLMERAGWYAIFVEVVCIAKAANRLDLDQVIRHTNHLQAAVVQLRGFRAEIENDREPSFLSVVEEVAR